MRLLLRGVFLPLAIVGVIAFTASAATAQEVALSVPITTVTRGEPGSLHVLGSRPSAELEGQTCDVVVEGDNNGSVHPGNDLIVTTETGSVELLDFERAAGAVTEGNGSLTIGATLTLTLRLGDDIGPNGLVTSSGGAVVSLVDCTSPPPPTTTTAPTTTTSPPTTVSTPPTTTKAPCKDNPQTVENDCVPTLPHTGGESLPGAFLGVAAIGAGFGLVKVASKGLVR